MSEMTKDEVTIGLFDECKRLQAKVEKLEKQLKDALHLLFKSEDV